MLASTLMLSAATSASVIDILYETVSATATVGLSRNLTSSLNIIGKIIIIATMYLGRIGPISLAIAFQSKKKTQNSIIDPTEEVSIG
jgi:trk system potassium uptake protein TrkH